MSNNHAKKKEVKDKINSSDEFDKQTSSKKLSSSVNTKKQTQKNSRLPLLITRGIVIIPGVNTTINIGRTKSINAINESKNLYDGKIIVTSQTDASIDDPTENDIYKVGTLCEFEISEKIDEDDYLILLKPEERVQLKKVIEVENINRNSNDKRNKNDAVIFSEYVILEEKAKISSETINSIINYFNSSKNDIAKYVDEETFRKIEKTFTKEEITSEKVDFLCSITPIAFPIKQELLEILNPNDRFSKFLLAIMPKTDKDKIDNEITRKINKNLSKQQKEFYLRERIRVIKEELGDITSKEDDADVIRNIVKNNPYPEHIKNRILSEINKMESSSNSNEAMITKTYIEWLVKLPWWQKTDDSNDIYKVESILNKNHYGLEKVKERIIEYLAMRMKSNTTKGSVICLVGPPGVGKTSLAKSVAEALNKKFVKVSLGGLRDEAEIKGHRKTYVGAMPGRVIKEMKKSGVINPLMLLDEIDKLNSDYRGDPASTLLDILDIEQQTRFSDNYIEEDYDLSNVLFIATANYEENIPEPLRDRLEIIRLSSYTENEKFSISKEYLIPKILDESQLNQNELEFTNEAIEYIIKRYTREAGVREAERCFRQIARKFVLRQLKGEIEKQVIGIQEVKEYLKKELYDYTNKDEISIPGIVNGMAYTSFGGDLLPIEVTYAKGKGKIQVTGNLKETMKESASVAYGFVRANADRFKIDSSIFNEIDLFIHVPSGGIPKDGPSAGVTLTTAIISALKNIPVSSDISMTGEITLRGKVLIIGGVKEKTISAVRGGINKIFLPREDERYIVDIPKEVLNKVTIKLVDTYDDIYNELFLKYDNSSNINFESAIK